MTRERQRVTFIGSVSGVLTVLSGIAIFFPSVREWMDEHGLAGWIAATIAVACVFFASGIADRCHQIEVSTLVDRRARDFALVTERLRGWTATGEFMTFLTHDVLYDYFPAKFQGEMRERTALWRTDGRKLETQPIREAWNDVERDVAAYHETLGSYTWPKERGAEIDYETLSLPREWKYGNREQREQYESAMEELRVAWNSAIRSLKSLFMILHEYQPSTRTDI